MKLVFSIILILFLSACSQEQTNINKAKSQHEYNKIIKESCEELGGESHTNLFGYLFCIK